MQLLRWTLLAGVLLQLLGGCGYRPEGRYLSAPEPPTLAVDLLLNQTGRAFLENEVSNRVVERFARSTSYRLVASVTDATLQLAGAVTAYTTTPAAYDRDDNIRLYRSSMTAQVTVSNVADGRVVWRGEMVETAEFAASADRAQQQANENTAVATLAERLADEVYNRLAAGF